jgi:hypothetical protein
MFYGGALTKLMTPSRRTLKPGMRPIAAPEDDRVIVSPSESRR